MINYGKFDSMKSLEHFDKPKDSNTFSKLTISSRSLATNVKYNPTETSREIMKATMNLQMKKFADIVNYNNADNKTLQNQMKNIKILSGFATTKSFKKI